MNGDLVLVTGGSGFLASHCLVQLLRAGYCVRTTIRSPAREPEVRNSIAAAGITDASGLSFSVADLSRDYGWDEAVADCRYVLHVASPFPRQPPNHEDELIFPARDGALRVLSSAANAGVERVVMTSSFAAIGYGHASHEQLFTEADWTDINGPDVTPYVKSKTLAEQAAWDFIGEEGGALELSVVNPVGIYGPVLNPDFATSILIVQRLLKGDLPGCPRIWFGVVDVRDVADLHVRAMTHPAAAGERFLAVAGDPMSFQEVAHLLKSRLGSDASKVPTRTLPDWLVRLVAMFDRSARMIVPELGKVKRCTAEKARRVLDWNSRSNDEAILSTGRSLLQLGLAK